MNEQILLDGTTIKVYSYQEWFEMFSKYCYGKYESDGQVTGQYCCGYHWCCNVCRQKHQCGCDDCVQTIVDILEEHNVTIVTSDLDFESWENKAKALYEEKRYA